MPHEVQTHIGQRTSFTAGADRLHDGREFPAFLAVGRNGIDGCQVYEKETSWLIYYKYPEKRWLSFRAEWLPEPERPPHISFDDETVFPLEICVQVPWQEGDRPSRYRVTADGQMREIRG